MNEALEKEAQTVVDAELAKATRQARTATNLLRLLREQLAITTDRLRLAESEACKLRRRTLFNRWVDATVEAPCQPGSGKESYSFEVIGVIDDGCGDPYTDVVAYWPADGRWTRVLATSSGGETIEDIEVRVTWWCHKPALPSVYLRGE